MTEPTGIRNCRGAGVNGKAGKDGDAESADAYGVSHLGGAYGSVRQGCAALRAIAAALAARGYDTEPMGRGCDGEPLALAVTNPVSRAYAEVYADDGGAELCTWSGLRDDADTLHVTRMLIRLLTTGPEDQPKVASDDGK
jgi:hypothetical protein